MVVMRRLLLLAFVLALPVAMTAGLYLLTLYGLQLSQRTIEPRILQYSAVVEYIVFLFIAIVDARGRW